MSDLLENWLRVTYYENVTLIKKNISDNKILVELEKRMNMRRRDFLISGIGAAAILQTAGSTALAQNRRRSREPRIGIQLYAVRNDFSKDVPGTIKNMAELGYQGVEFWGYGGTPNVFQDWSAEKLRKVLEDNKIRCCGMHINLSALSKENIETTIKNNQVLRNRYLNVASAGKMMESPETIKKFADLLNESAKKLQEHRMRVGYHCHGFDFKQVDGVTAWDTLFGQVDKEVMMQLDTGNCAEGGGDPVAVLKKFPGRAITLHVKEFKEGPLKADNAVWKEIIATCKELHKTRWYIIEQGEASGGGLDIPRESLKELKKLLA